MKKILSVLITLMGLFVGYANCNPIAINGDSYVKKSWERCLISVDDSSARVSCAVGYVTERRANSSLRFTVPVFLPASDNIDLKKTAELISVRMECGKKVYKPIRIRVATDVIDAPEGRVKIDCDFKIAFPKGDGFSLVVSYNQPLINKVAYYLPLFENNPDVEKLKRFMITFFPAQTNQLKLITKHKTRAKVLKTRVSITPKHRELIGVKVEPAT